MEMQPYIYQSKFITWFLGGGSALTGFIPVAKDERGSIDTLNCSLLFNKFGKVPVEIVTRIKVGSV